MKNGIVRPENTKSLNTNDSKKSKASKIIDICRQVILYKK